MELRSFGVSLAAFVFLDCGSLRSGAEVGGIDLSGWKDDISYDKKDRDQ